MNLGVVFISEILIHIHPRRIDVVIAAFWTLMDGKW